MQAEVTALRAELEASRNASVAERAATAIELESRAKASQASAAELLEAANENRVAHLQQSAARRIANRGIVMGFSAWQGQWEQAVRQKRMLAAAAERLARPALAAAVAHWVRDWRLAADQKRLEAMSYQERRQLAKEASLHEELAALRAELETEREASASERAASAFMVGQHTASLEAGTTAFQALLEERLEAEELKRVVHIQQSAARRIAKRDIAIGFSAWQGQWKEAARRERLLAAAAGRLARPALTAAVAQWVGDWSSGQRNGQRAAARAAANEAKARLLVTNEAERLELKDQIDNLASELRRVQAPHAYAHTRLGPCRATR